MSLRRGGRPVGAATLGNMHQVLLQRLDPASASRTGRDTPPSLAIARMQSSVSAPQFWPAQARSASAGTPTRRPVFADAASTGLPGASTAPNAARGEGTNVIIATAPTE